MNVESQTVYKNFCLQNEFATQRSTYRIVHMGELLVDKCIHAFRCIYTIEVFNYSMYSFILRHRYH